MFLHQTTGREQCFERLRLRDEGGPGVRARKRTELDEHVFQYRDYHWRAVLKYDAHYCPASILATWMLAAMVLLRALRIQSEHSIAAVRPAVQRRPLRVRSLAGHPIRAWVLVPQVGNGAAKRPLRHVRSAGTDVLGLPPGRAVQGYGRKTGASGVAMAIHLRLPPGSSRGHIRVLLPPGHTLHDKGLLPERVGKGARSTAHRRRRPQPQGPVQPVGIQTHPGLVAAIRIRHRLQPLDANMRKLRDAVLWHLAEIGREILRPADKQHPNDHGRD